MLPRNLTETCLKPLLQRASFLVELEVGIGPVRRSVRVGYETFVRGDQGDRPSGSALLFSSAAVGNPRNAHGSDFVISWFKLVEFGRHYREGRSKSRPYAMVLVHFRGHRATLFLLSSDKAMAEKILFHAVVGRSESPAYLMWYLTCLAVDGDVCKHRELSPVIKASPKIESDLDDSSLYMSMLEQSREILNTAL